MRRAQIPCLKVDYKRQENSYVQSADFLFRGGIIGMGILEYARREETAIPNMLQPV